MNKINFFDELNRSLLKLSKEERDDILRDMEEYFYEGNKRGLSEEEIIEKFGSPKKMSETIIAEAKVKRISTATTIPKKMSAVVSATLAILVLAPFSFLFIVIPLLFIGALFCGLWPLALFLTISLPFVLCIFGFSMFQIGFHFIALLCLLFFALGWISMVVAVMLGLFFFSVLLFQGLVKLFQWNINFIKKQIRS